MIKSGEGKERESRLFFSNFLLCGLTIYHHLQKKIRWNNDIQDYIFCV